MTVRTRPAARFPVLAGSAAERAPPQALATEGWEAGIAGAISRPGDRSSQKQAAGQNMTLVDAIKDPGADFSRLLNPIETVAGFKVQPRSPAGPAGRRPLLSEGPSLPLLHIVILALIQGITEFLPISSSGHLILAWNSFDGLGLNGIEQAERDRLTLDIAVHVGTLLAVCCYTWREIAQMAQGRLGASCSGAGRPAHAWR